MSIDKMPYHKPNDIQGLPQLRQELEQQGTKPLTSTEFVISLLVALFSNNWEDKAGEYGVSQDEITNFSNNNPNFSIDFSDIEKGGDIQNLIEQTVKELGISANLVRAIIKIESSGNPNAIRFEKHIYNRERAKGINEEEARMLATSYGYFQIMGFNYRACGYNSVEEFVDAMKKPENQFIAFTNFVKSNKTLHSVMKDLNYPKIARYYNGPNYAQNNYDKKLANLEIASTLKTL